MAAKTWRLVVTELGGSSTLHEVTVEAKNWMAALTASRQEIGEPGGMPTGASCAVAPDGKVTIHDPMARRTYVLTPDVAKSFTRNKPSGPRIPSDEAAPAPPARKVSKKTIAYDSAPVVAAAQAAHAAAQAAAAPQAQPAPQPHAQPAPQPQAQPAPQQPKSVPAERPSSPPLASIGEWSLLSERSEEPTAESPLFYLERTFVVAEGTMKERAEAILHDRLAESQDEAKERPAGKFLNFAAFDHAWADRPKRPPLVQIQWKDWRGDPDVSYPLADKLAARAARKSAASVPPPDNGSSAPSAPSAPAPSAAPSAPAPSPSAAPVAAAQPVAAAVAAPTPAPAPTAAAPSTPAPAPVVAPIAPQPAAPQPKPAPQPRTSTDEHDARLAHAFEATQDLFFLSTPAEGLDFAVRLLDELVPCEACSACLYDINTDEFRFVVLTGPGGEERKGEAIPSRTGILGAAAERVGAPFVVADVASDTRFDPGVDGRVGLELTTALYMAIHHQGRLLGMLQLANRRGTAGFSANDGEVVSYIAKQLAEFLYQARIAPDQGARI